MYVQIAPLNTVTHTAITVGTSWVVGLSSNADRKYALLVNDSDIPIYISCSSSVAVANACIRVNANGGAYEMSRGKGNLYCGQITCISTAAGKILIATEGI